MSLKLEASQRIIKIITTTTTTTTYKKEEEQRKKKEESLSFIDHRLIVSRYFQTTMYALAKYMGFEFRPKKEFAYRVYRGEII